MREKFSSVTKNQNKRNKKIICENDIFVMLHKHRQIFIEKLSGVKENDVKDIHWLQIIGLSLYKHVASL